MKIRLNKICIKKWLCLLGIIICCMHSALLVHADIIWEPDDNFYNQNASECTYVNRVYTANGPDGIVIVYKSPESPQVVTQIDNGTQIYISYTYQAPDGIVWGIYEDFVGGITRWITGWIPMDYMALVYDSISFAEEFDADIVAQDGGLDDAYLGQEIYLWKYPGSTEQHLMPSEDYLPSYSSVFVDEEGRSWGNVGYYFGMKNTWVCIDQPTADFDTLYPEGAPQRGTEQAGSTERIVPGQNNAATILTVVLVLAVVLITAGLLVILRRRR